MYELRKDMIRSQFSTGPFFKQVVAFDRTVEPDAWSDYHVLYPTPRARTLASASSGTGTRGLRSASLATRLASSGAPSLGATASHYARWRYDDAHLRPCHASRHCPRCGRASNLNPDAVDSVPQRHWATT